LRDHLSYGIIQCYLPPGRGDSPDVTLAFTSTHFTIPQKVEGCSRLYIAEFVVINTRPSGLQSRDLTHRSRASLPLDHCDLQWSSGEDGPLHGSLSWKDTNLLMTKTLVMT